MVGQYPFQHGSACKTHADGEARLQQILQACSPYAAAVTPRLHARSALLKQR